MRAFAPSIVTRAALFRLTAFRADKAIGNLIFRTDGFGHGVGVIPNTLTNPIVPTEYNSKKIMPAVYGLPVRNIEGDERAYLTATRGAECRPYPAANTCSG